MVDLGDCRSEALRIAGAEEVGQRAWSKKGFSSEGEG
jgi:hypothetical protein